MPVQDLKHELKVPTLLYPTVWLISAMFSRESERSRFASSKRIALRKRRGETPIRCVNSRVKWNLLNPAAWAMSSMVRSSLKL